jgi:hypothetical protein
MLDGMPLNWKDLLTRLLAALPNYIVDLTSIVSSPKRFVLQRALNNESPLVDALIFLTISSVIALGLQLPFMQQNAFEMSIQLSFSAFVIVAFGGAVCLAWRCVKGTGSIINHFVIHFYYVGVLDMIWACYFMSFMGIFRVADRHLCGEFMLAICRGEADWVIRNYDRLMASNAGIPLQFTASFFVSVMLLWIVAGWGAYRELNHLSSLRSAIAFILFVGFSIPVMAVVMSIANASACARIGPDCTVQTASSI